MRTVEHVDIPRFMGPWYVVANIPTIMERRACNAIERYTLRPDGNVDIHFSFDREVPGGKRRTLRARGFVQDQTGATWKVQFLWPIRLPFLVIYVDPDYKHTLIGYPKHKYLWIMTREANPDETVLQQLVDTAVDMGYDRARIQRVRQEWHPTSDSA